MSGRTEEASIAAVVAPVLELGGAASPAGEPAPLASVRKADMMVPDAAPLVLRVLTGPLEGADAKLSADEAITVGRGFRNDVVLRDKAVGDTRVSLEAPDAEAGDRTVRLRVLSGQVVLLGQRLVAPAEAVLPHYLPLAVGASALAVGGADEARWDEAAAMAPALTAAPANDAGMPPKSRAGWIRDVGVGACAFGALAACTMFLAPGDDEAFVTPPTEVVRSAVEAGGYGEVLVSARPDGESVLIGGFVATDARKAALRAQLDALEVPWEGEVRSGEAAARQVGDLFVANGMPAASVSYEGAGLIAVSGVAADQASADRVRGSALSDVPYLAAITVETDEPEASFPSKAFTATIEKVVGGEFGYVVTNDGQRLFVGAQTPQGGKITSISDGEVTIEDAGEPMTYTF